MEQTELSHLTDYDLYMQYSIARSDRRSCPTVDRISDGCRRQAWLNWNRWYEPTLAEMRRRGLPLNRWPKR